MCWSKIFKKKQKDQGVIVVGTVTYPPSGSVPASPVLPHPQEAGYPSATPECIDIDLVRSQWLDKWAVVDPIWWIDNLKIKLDTSVEYAHTHMESMTIDLNPKWANKGVLAHEAAHIVWGNLLSYKQKSDFQTYFYKAKTSDILVQHLFSINPYGAYTAIEGHAEIYRYIGDQMPWYLKEYYPRLL